MAPDPFELFHTPLSSQAFQKFQDLQVSNQAIQLSSFNDKWKYPWGNFSYSSIKMYKWCTSGEPAYPIFKKLWKNATMLKYKIFFWLLLHDRVNTRNLLHRKSFFLPSYSCELCHFDSEETTLHLFWDCPFALSCRDSIITHKNIGISVLDEIIFLTQALPTPIAMEIVIIGCWQLWMQRNSKIFKTQPPLVTSWRRLLKIDLLLVRHRVKRKFEDILWNWNEAHLN